jgi:hypothetical protein
MGHRGLIVFNIPDINAMFSANSNLLAVWAKCQRSEWSIFGVGKGLNENIVGQGAYFDIGIVSNEGVIAVVG